MAKKDRKKRPEWAPENAGSEFASEVLPAMDDRASSGQVAPHVPPSRREPSSDELVRGVLHGDRTLLAQAITLVESNAPDHQEKAREVLRGLAPHAKPSIRVGITGVPGVGKSTFIEAIGLCLLREGHHVAVLAVDPSSERSRGSILGDKTRMERLARDERAFIRPSPTSGTLGGVTRKSRETIALCEAFGFDVVLVETVGVGQSETAVRRMVDFFLLLMLPGAGDELQGLKKGVIELADALVFNKADNGGERRAKLAAMEYGRALHYLAAATPGWTTEAHTCSALTGKGISEAWALIERFVTETKASGVFVERRREQLVRWTHAMVHEELEQRFYHHAKVARELPSIEAQVAAGRLLPAEAVRGLLALFDPRK
ncbi:MAG: methylmalonyl Co-A mutase-associated GTPase MeaB [Deltaproteobacteria bacterium]|nr:methylmalonyl Co-A mutase-associated GTPase MeaB [Deltaproteobacteria bacterium]